MAKELLHIIKLEIQAGKANPAPPIGPILGQNGIPIQPFCQEFNAKTADMGEDFIPIMVHVYKDRTYKIFYKQPTVAGMIKKAINVQKGSGTPNKDKIGKIDKKKVEEIAERKMPDLNTKNKASAMKIVEGVAKSLGVEIKD